MKLSTIILAKNEEEVIKRCLESVKKISDEIIVIDNASTDDTRKIAEQYGAKLVSTNTDNFSELRNLGLQKAKGTWVFYIDADEIVSDSLEKEINEVIEEGSIEAAFRIRRKNFYFGGHQWPYIERLERLFQKERLRRWYGELHESAEVDGRIGELHGYLLHYTHKDLTSMVKKTIEWSKTEAQLRFSAGHPNVTWWRFFRVMGTAFYNSYIRQQGWRVGTTGLIESMYQAFSIFITYARLWELQQKVKDPSFDAAQDRNAKIKTTTKN